MYKLNEDYEKMELDEEIILQNNVTGEVHILNHTATIIFNLLIENVSIEKISRNIMNKYSNLSEEEVKIDIEQTKDILIEKSIIIIHEN